MNHEERLAELRIDIHEKAQKLADSYVRCYGIIPFLIEHIVRYTTSMLKYNPDQPRAPAGNPDGGEWAPGGGRSDSTDHDQETSQPANKFSISKETVNYIKSKEKLSFTTYPDQAGNPSIGYGHRLLPGETFPNGVTREEAENLLQQDLAIAENAVRDNVTVDLTQNQYDALVILTYNIGEDNFASSTLLDLLNRGNYDGAANQFAAWNKITVDGEKKPSLGLTIRRREERNIFLYGNYP